ncbi:MAG TPA: SGNH/GDSL hydrolase family protein [Phototrophicaceae bacterium]|jgi:hypothetical protein|nr:SGNH/GDSL hydrolase family protein [Phototrophicaceae bacterium]
MAQTETVNVVTKKSLPGWMINLALMVVGLALAGLALLALFTIFPQLRPGITLFTVNQGDIFLTEAKWIKPLDNPNEILAMYWISWDKNGFRVPEHQADYYPIVTIGDSYTEAPNSARPWSDVLAEKTGLPVRNLGYRGFGPIEETEVLKRFAPELKPQTVIVGYFEGNDLSNAVTALNQPQEMPWNISSESHALKRVDFSDITDRDIRYPMKISANDIQHDIVFLEPYAWVLNTSKEDFEHSRNLEITLEHYREMRATVSDACFIVAYFPGAPHIYLPYLMSEYQPILMQKAEHFTAKAGKKLKQDPATDMTFDEMLANLPNQRDAVKEMIEAEGMIFFDLTPVLEQGAAQGQMLYYTYDTHWNQDGHNLVGQAIADFLAINPCQK